MEILPGELFPSEAEDIALRLFKTGIKFVVARKWLTAFSAQLGKLPLFVRLGRYKHVLSFEGLTAKNMEYAL
jgi:hypothetical protein